MQLTHCQQMTKRIPGCKIRTATRQDRGVEHDFAIIFTVEW